MNNEMDAQARLITQRHTPEGMATELVRVDAIANALLASVGRPPNCATMPSEKLTIYISARRAQMESENLDLGDAMEVIGAVANLLKMFH